MQTKTEKILWVLRILAWIAMIGYTINLVSQIICLVISFKNPEAAKQIPGVVNLLSLLLHNFRYYVIAMAFVIILSAMSVYLWHLVITLLSKLNLKSPFTIQVSQKLEKIAYWLFAIWVVHFIGKKYVDWISQSVGEQQDIITIGNEFLFIAGIVYIISQIFRHGIEMQEENQQTI